MNLQPVTHDHYDPFTARCCSCGRYYRPAYADLDGPAFVAYYCKECGDEMKKEQPK